MTLSIQRLRKEAPGSLFLERGPGLSSAVPQPMNLNLMVLNKLASMTRPFTWDRGRDVRDQAPGGGENLAGIR